jgi:AraC-like DNA-binding protein
MNANGNLIHTLAQSEMFTEYARAYGDAIGLPLTLRPVETWQLPGRGRRWNNSFCALMATQSKSCSACLQLQEQLAQGAMHGPATLTCAYGLSETAVPVQLGNQTIGFLQTGHLLRQKPTEATFQRVANVVAKTGATVDPEKLRAAYFLTPVVSDRKLESVTRLLTTFAEHLSMRGNQLAVLSANSELPLITKAKDYIQTHLGEVLSLGRVAGAVHVSPFHLCKKFKKATGINFTEYVARVRTEKAKNLLLNPNFRVSETAYEAGFQSLTDFNRVFKKLVGQSPTGYRAQLPSLARTGSARTTARRGRPLRRARREATPAGPAGGVEYPGSRTGETTVVASATTHG